MVYLKWSQSYSVFFFSGTILSKGELTLCEAPNRETRPDQNTGNYVPYSYRKFDKCVGSSMSPANHVTLKMQGTEPTVYSPYPRRLERQTFADIIKKTAHSPECCSGPGLEPSTSRTADWRSTN